MTTPGQRTRDVLERCRVLGFAGAGVCPVQPTRFGEEFRAWLAAGRHGSMTFMEEFVEQRVNPGLILEGARWMVMVADLYTPRRHAADAPLQPRHGRIARYARGRDYHEVIKRRLHRLADDLRERHPGAAVRAFTDTVPVLEREHAARAGLGWLAKNTMLIHPRLGSYFLLGGVLTSLELETPPEQRPVTDHCGTCTRCIDACPSHAITPHGVDATRCISYLTIEHRGDIAPDLFDPVGTWLYGCDICQEVCPHNSPRGMLPGTVDDPAPPSQRGGGWSFRALQPGSVSQDLAVGSCRVAKRNPDYAPRVQSLDVLNILNWDEDGRRGAFTTSAMKRATLDMMKRNALIVAGNLLRRNPDDPLLAPLVSRVRRASEDPGEPELVRRTAREVLRRSARQAAAARTGEPE